MSQVTYAGTSAHTVEPVLMRRNVVPFTFGAVSVLGLGAANGGYFPTSWGWPLLAFAALVLWDLNAGSTARLTAFEWTTLGGFGALTAWYALSSFWGQSGAALQETFEVALYAAGVAAAIVVSRRASPAALLAGTLTGASAISAYSLATRLFPDRVGTFNSVAVYRLSTPLGYWNALGLLAVVGVLLAVSLVTTASTPTRIALAALPVPILVLTLYFTFSRGSWLSLAAGAIVAIALDPRRLRTTLAVGAVAIPSAAVVLFASHSNALTHEGAVVTSAAHDGHRVALVLLGLVAASGALAALILAGTKRLRVPVRVDRAYSILLAGLAVVAIAVTLVHYGGPSASARKTWDSFAAPPPKTQVDLQKRLFTFSGNGRVDLWRAAWHDFSSHPFAGSGAGTYERYWLQHRTAPLKVKNAHSLYLETLAELGIVGLVLLLVALLTPLVVAVRMRARRGVAVATGAYVAYLVGAGVDWDWQLASVTLAALFVGAALLVSTRTDEDITLGDRTRFGLMAAAVTVGAAGFVFLVGNMFLARASSASAKGNWSTAARDAKRASDWLPWSTAPLDRLGNAQAGAGDTSAAEATLLRATRKDPSDWNLWFDLARAASGKEQADAIAHASALNPLSPEIAELKSELGSQTGISITVKK